jgi:hypothetical protein
MTYWWISMGAAALKLRQLAENSLPPSLLDSFFNEKHLDDIPPLNLPEVPNILPRLLQFGLDVTRASLLHHEFTLAINQIDKSLSHSYLKDAPKFRSVKGLQTSRVAFIEALQSQSLVVRSQSIERLWNTLLSHVQSLQRMEAATTSQTSTPASTGPSNTSRKAKGRAHQFTKEQTAGLKALLAHDDQYSSEDKDLIAHELNLTRGQVNRWVSQYPHLIITETTTCSVSDIWSVQCSVLQCPCTKETVLLSLASSKPC